MYFLEVPPKKYLPIMQLCNIFKLYLKYLNTGELIMHVDAHRCPQNHRCPAIRICPVGAIRQQGNALPIIEREKCVECGACASFCPMGAIKE
jgi:ferredoxin